MIVGSSDNEFNEFFFGLFEKFELLTQKGIDRLVSQHLLEGIISFTQAVFTLLKYFVLVGSLIHKRQD